MRRACSLLAVMLALATNDGRFWTVTFDDRPDSTSIVAVTECKRGGQNATDFYVFDRQPLYGNEAGEVKVRRQLLPPGNHRCTVLIQHMAGTEKGEDIVDSITLLQETP
jgi:hypothetical protein